MSKFSWQVNISMTSWSCSSHPAGGRPPSWAKGARSGDRSAAPSRRLGVLHPSKRSSQKKHRLRLTVRHSFVDLSSYRPMTYRHKVTFDRKGDVLSLSCCGMRH